MTQGDASKMTLEDTLAAFVECEAFDRVADYAKRGRRFNGLDADDLTTRWIAAFKVWAANPRDRAESDDLEAELQLRGLKSPYDLVRKEFDALIAAAEAIMAENNPRRSLELNVELQRDLVEFVRKTKNSN
jgi:hypothetical protein